MLDIRDLLARARDRFHTIQTEFAATYDAELLELAWARSTSDIAALAALGAAATFQLERSGREDPGAEPDRFRHLWRVWWRKPDCWRDDILWENGETAVSIACGAESSAYVSYLRTLYTSRPAEGLPPRTHSAPGPRIAYRLPTLQRQQEMIPLVDPSFLASGWALSAAGEAVHAGREGLRVEAVRIDEDCRTGPWEGVDRYELVVDRETGVLLRCAGMLEDEEAGVFSVLRVRFDEPIPDSVFRPHPPPGTNIIAM